VEFRREKAGRGKHGTRNGQKPKRGAGRFAKRGKSQALGGDLTKGHELNAGSGHRYSGSKTTNRARRWDCSFFTVGGKNGGFLLQKAKMK